MTTAKAQRDDMRLRSTGVDQSWLVLLLDDIVELEQRAEANGVLELENHMEQMRIWKNGTIDTLFDCIRQISRRMAALEKVAEAARKYCDSGNKDYGTFPDSQAALAELDKATK